MNVLLFAQVVFDPCEGLEVGSWLWWLRGCWMLPNEVTMAIGIAALVGVAAFSLRQVNR